MVRPILTLSLLTVGIFAMESSIADVSQPQVRMQDAPPMDQQAKASILHQLQAHAPDAPTTDCSFHDIEAITPIRITIGDGPIPYHFACGIGRSRHMCEGTLPPDLIVNLGTEQNGWACVTGIDSTSGWIPVKYLGEVPTDPKVPLSAWLGWWHQGEEVKGEKSNRLLITNQPGSHMLHVSGRAYWHGLNDNVHFGYVEADATPIGIYLHLVGSYSCVVDLEFDLATHTLNANDNTQCGALNVRFNGTWTHYVPKLHSKKK